MIQLSLSKSWYQFQESLQKEDLYKTQSNAYLSDPKMMEWETFWFNEQNLVSNCQKLMEYIITLYQYSSLGPLSIHFN